jgi:5-methylcytosine-specific restriction endonuclease McrA
MEQPRVFVLDKHKRPLMPCHPARARQLLREGRAVVHRRVPFVIRLKDRNSGAVQPVALLLDPGSRTSGMALAREDSSAEVVAGISRHALWLAELTHRGEHVRRQLRRRAQHRRRRRSLHLRYRAVRFDNRRRRAGWLPPSILSRVDNVLTWAIRLRRWAPLSRIVLETVRFDTQLVQNPEITGVEYQQGQLAGYEVREYLLEKWGRRCAYCNRTGLPLQIEHVVCKARGGTDRVSNLTLACADCNHQKGTQRLEDFLARNPERVQQLLAAARAPLLKSAAAVNASRSLIYERLTALGLQVEVGTGGRTKWNRIRIGIPKTHATDALCVGHVQTVTHAEQHCVGILARGRGRYQRTTSDQHGFPRQYFTRRKRHFGFQTGDLVRCPWPWQSLRRWPMWSPILASGVAAGGQGCPTPGH